VFSLQKLFSHEDKFFDLLEASSQEAMESTRLLIDMLRDRNHAHPLDPFILSRLKDKRITEQISHALVNTFVTGLEREDIEALSNALYRIPKTIEKFAERFNLAPQAMRGVEFTQQIELIHQAIEIVAEMVEQLRRMPPLETMKELNDRLQVIEGQADDVMVELLRGVYGGQFERMQAMVVRDLYDLLEKVIDRCRDAGNIITRIVLKNS
jgi:uncharacterized protein Yka (UPF0111/DUF47 family)